MKLCYFISEYPAVPHTFIRREVVELEASGFSILRVSLRSADRALIDPADLRERERTHYILESGVAQYVSALAREAVSNPRALLRAIRCAVKMMRRSHRPAAYHLIYLAEALVLARWVTREKIMHVHAHFGTNGAEVAMLTHLLTGRPYSFTVHGPDEFDRPEYYGLAEKVKHAAFVCAISSYTRSQLCRWIRPEDWQKIKIVRCGLDRDFTISRLTPRPSKNHLVNVGRLHEQKGQLVLLEALAILQREGLPFKVTIAGDGPLRPVLERRIQKLQLADRVELTGWLTNEEVRHLLTRARALVLPSFAEGIPLIVTEAFSLERPVITTFVGGIPELVTDGVCGWLVPAGDVDRLAAAIRDSLNASDDHVLAMGMVGRKRVLEMHDIRQECRKLATLFRNGIAANDAATGGSSTTAAPEVALTSRPLVSADTEAPACAGEISLVAGCKWEKTPEFIETCRWQS